MTSTPVSAVTVSPFRTVNDRAAEVLRDRCATTVPRAVPAPNWQPSNGHAPASSSGIVGRAAQPPR
jgi:hypothetical protein